MGLAEARKRRKISTDPNNTTWTSNSDTFGKRILTSQGWKPGDRLGARNAEHAAHYTSASDTHIRVSVKDDTYGLGTNQARDDEAKNLHRLGAYEDVLSRLNGKAEDTIRAKKDTRNDLGRRLYVEQKFGPMRFVSAGFLVGDEVQRDIHTQEEPEKSDDQTEMEDHGCKVKRKEKNWLEKPEADDEDTERKRRKIEKRQRKEEKRLRKLKRKTRNEPEKNVPVPDQDPESSIHSTCLPFQDQKVERQPGLIKSNRNSQNTVKAGDKQSRSVKKREHKQPSTDMNDPKIMIVPYDSTDLHSQPTKQSRKSSKRMKRMKHNLEDIVEESTASPNVPDKAINTKNSSRQVRSDTGIETTTTSTPAPETVAPSTAKGMRSVRKRYIQHKKLAGLDSSALNEILMVRSG